MFTPCSIILACIYPWTHAELQLRDSFFRQRGQAQQEVHHNPDFVQSEVPLLSASATLEYAKTFPSSSVASMLVDKLP